ncbi:MAG TPA: IclR family transcriptional regulator [Streptosporangiaceae bacterium]|nr:IclR family transcriptional regulator [Streptosporangiaceae bacterium]
MPFRQKGDDTRPLLRVTKTCSMLARGLALISAFSATWEELPLSELSRRTGLPKPTVHRLIGELTRSGFLDQGAKGYRPGRHLFMLGQHSLGLATLRQAALPYMAELFAVTGENTLLAVRFGAEVVVLEKICGRESARLLVKPGSRLSATHTALGQTLLACGPGALRGGLGQEPPLAQELRKIADHRYAISRADLTAGIISLAAPVDPGGSQALAAIGISGRLVRPPIEDLRPQLRHAAAMLSQDLARLAARSRAARHAIFHLADGSVGLADETDPMLAVGGLATSSAGTAAKQLTSAAC